MAVIPLIYNEMKSMFRLRDGVLEWKQQRTHGMKARTNIRCYRSVRINNRSVLAHRITYCLKTKKDLPQNVIIDHKDGDFTNNHASNLRRSTNQQNCWNQKKKCTNTTGVKGLSVQNCHGTLKYSCQIIKNNKRYMKRFPKTSSGLKAAKSWLITQRILLHGEYARFK